MSQQQKEKGSGYINIVADLTVLQSIMCCNNDMNKNSLEADTPRHRPGPSAIIQTREETTEETRDDNDIHVQVSK